MVVEVGVEALGHRVTGRFVGAEVLQHVVDEATEQLVVVGRQQHAGDDGRRDVLRVVGVAAGAIVVIEMGSDGVQEVPGELASGRLEVLDRSGANAGRSRRRAKAWKGGSDVIGGAPPMGAGSSGLSSDTTTPWLEKCSVS